MTVASATCTKAANMLLPDRPVAIDSTVAASVFKAYSTVAAGFPSPADDYATKSIDLNAVLIIAVVDGEFTCKRLFKRAGVIKLQAANPAFADIVPSDGQTVELWGTVTRVIKTLTV
jgi:hypothetical protein